MLGLALQIRLELRSGFVRVSAVLGQGKQFRSEDDYVEVSHFIELFNTV